MKFNKFFFGEEYPSAMTVIQRLEELIIRVAILVGLALFARKYLGH